MIIIYGGSFNPPTIAHYEIAKYIIDMFPNDDFLFLPTNNFYEKDNLKDFHYRVDMLELVCERLDGKAKVSTFEIELDKYYGTYYTLKHYNEPCFVMGADNLNSINKWINYPKVVMENKFIIVPREDYNINNIINDNEILTQYKCNFIILDKFKKLYISSSKYRETHNDNYLLPEVADYIKKNNIYKERN